ncbi:MAG: enolase C-terminal domain-like protein, partial [Chloroflexota bacterium]
LNPVSSDTEVQEALGLSTEALENDRVQATAVSALRTAMLDAQARREGVSLAEFLGAEKPAGGFPAVRLYGNINRSMLPHDSGPVDRSPHAFAETAAGAVAAGFDTVKCAPFDECRAPFGGKGLPDEAREGLSRIAAARDAVGPTVTLLVDCHRRFDIESALALEEELASLGVAWYEEPINAAEDPEGMRRIRDAASIPVAGAEGDYGARRFADFIEEGILDIVMPDVKFCGGAGEAAATGSRVEKFRPGSISMHSPAGPPSMLASAHATLAFAGRNESSILPVEHAWNEVTWRASVLEPAEDISQGALKVPGGPGLGAVLNPACIEARGRRWTP